MKKSLILAGMLSIVYANAQEGNVGINTENPKATLEVLPSVKNAAATATTNEGIVAPKLTKARIANIADANLVEGTLVYATDATYTGSNAKVAKITEKGYYFYNGTEWVKASGSAVTGADTSIYTADGTLTGDRVVDQAGKWLNFNDGGIRIKGNSSLFNPLVVNVMRTEGGGIAVHPNNMDNRIEFATNTNGDMRFYQNGSGDVMFVKKSGAAGGLVGIGNTNPKVRLDVTGGGRFRRINNNSTIEIDTDNGFWGYVDYRRNDLKRWDVGMTNEEDTGENEGSNYYISSFNDAGEFLRRDFTINRATGNTGIGTNKPSEKLHVVGNIRSTTLSGDGEKIVVANNDGTLTKGVSLSNFVTSNIYTADGTLTANRTVDMNKKNLSFTNGGNVGINNNNPVRKLDVVGGARFGNTEGFSIWMDVDNDQGVAIHRYRRNASPRWDVGMDGNADTDTHGGSNYYISSSQNDGNTFTRRLTILRENGNVGIHTATPTEKLDVNGNIRSSNLRGTGTRNVVADENGVLQIGEASTPAVEIGSTTGMQCNATNRGKMNFIQGADGKSDVFGVCMKNADGNYYWGYMVGGNNPTNGTGAFGSGL